METPLLFVCHWNYYYLYRNMSLTGAYSRIMNCRYCGKKVERGQKYCPHCGEPIHRNPCNGTQVDASEILKSGVNAGIDGFGKGWKQGTKLADNLNDASENHPRATMAVGGIFFFLAGLLILKMGMEESGVWGVLFFWAMSAFCWYRFYHLGKK